MEIGTSELDGLGVVNASAARLAGYRWRISRYHAANTAVSA